MALNADDLASKIGEYQQKLLDDISNDAASSDDALSYFEDACNDYFSANTTVSFSWVAFNPDGSPDSTTSFDSTDVKTNFSLGFVDPSGSLSPEACLLGLGSQFSLSVSLTVITHPSSFSVPPAVLFSMPCLLDPTNEIEIDKSNKALASMLVDWYKTCINPIPLPGSRASFTGVATMISIS